MYINLLKMNQNIYNESKISQLQTAENIIIKFKYQAKIKILIPLNIDKRLYPKNRLKN